jgi:hypothetical protein
MGGLRELRKCYNPAVPPRPKVEPIRNPTLFEMDKPEQAGTLANSLNVERPYSEPGLLLGTSGFTANGWAGRSTLPFRHEAERFPFLLRDPIQGSRN